MVDDFMSFVEQLSFWQNSDLSQPNQPSPTILAMPNAEVLYYPGLFEASESDALLAELQQIIPWQQEVIRLYGKSVPLPRLTAWYGDPGTAYTYSGITMQPLPWTTAVLNIRYSKARSSSPTE